MARKRKFTEQLEGQYIEQNSPFLRLPAELRDMIYKHVVKHGDSVAIIPEAPTARVAFASPFALRRIRESVPRGRRAIREERYLPPTNFINEYGRTQFARTLDSLPLPAVDVDRGYSIQITLTNTVNSSLYQLRVLLDQAMGGWNIRTSYDPSTFDEAYCRQLVPKLRWCHGRRVYNSHHWFAIEAAFEDAFTRYSAQDRIRRGQRKGKRLDAKTSRTKKK
ncbi:hypothetical protein LTR37_019339 [Vermiconidia calcicola]|uniref:Uncharacterized protein n=1 Tax=Vermiconidia calcicola TaxID=1690605 RepID=A0ACC3MEP6_9PEZI|nr:hypothetical protein LTR37_019339 [Vermiconidia calcicola]